MASGAQLDASRSSSAGKLIVFVAAIFLLAYPASAQSPSNDSERLAAAQKALDAQHWQEAATLASGPPNQPADLDFVEGLALARLEHWDDARASFEAGHRKSPSEPLFLVELAGVAYKQSDFRTAKQSLHAALRLDSHD